MIAQKKGQKNKKTPTENTHKKERTENISDFFLDIFKNKTLIVIVKNGKIKDFVRYELRSQPDQLKPYLTQANPTLNPINPNQSNQY